MASKTEFWLTLGESSVNFSYLPDAAVDLVYLDSPYNRSVPADPDLWSQVNSATASSAVR